MFAILNSHIDALQDKFEVYFPSNQDQSVGNLWVLDPFAVHEGKKLSTTEGDLKTEPSSDVTMKLQKEKCELPTFLAQIKKRVSSVE